MLLNHLDAKSLSRLESQRHHHWTEEATQTVEQRILSQLLSALPHQQAGTTAAQHA